VAASVLGGVGRREARVGDTGTGSFIDAAHQGSQPRSNSHPR